MIDHPSHQHQSVLLNEAISALSLLNSGIYIDATFGRGGHSRAILQVLSEKGRLIAIDRDPEAKKFATTFSHDKRFQFIAGEMQHLSSLIDVSLHGKIDGILMDIGVSSPQLDNADRGFSFMHDGPLDMRMDPDSGISAAEWVATTPLDEMITVFREYGEERFARKIAQCIVEKREVLPITSTHQLANIIQSAQPFREAHKHPATRCFQAIRIAVNDELGQLTKALEASLKLLRQKGRLAVISFHSLEDRLVKQFMRAEANVHDPLPDLPQLIVDKAPCLKIIGKPIKASAFECKNNPRARSAILRIAEKL